MPNRKIVRIIHWDSKERGRRCTRFFSNVDSVSCFEVDDAGHMVSDSDRFVLDQYTDHKENQARAKAEAAPDTPEQLAHDAELAEELRIAMNGTM